MKSVWTQNQKKDFRKEYSEGGAEYIAVAHVRFDDNCRNGHNELAITCGTYIQIRGGGWRMISAGCDHDSIRKYFPELAKYIKWHLCSTDGPMYYNEDSEYWLKEGNREYVKNTIVFGAVPELDTEEKIPNSALITEELLDYREYLKARLPLLLEAFRKDVEELGFVW